MYFAILAIANNIKTCVSNQWNIQTCKYVNTCIIEHGTNTTVSINNELGPSIRFYIGVAAAGRVGSRSWHSASRSHWVHSSVGQGLTRPTLTSLHLSHPCDASKKGGERSGLSWLRSGLVLNLWTVGQLPASFGHGYGYMYGQWNGHFLNLVIKLETIQL